MKVTKTLPPTSCSGHSSVRDNPHSQLQVNHTSETMGGSSSCPCTTYGNIMDVSTSGASRKTAEADGRNERGVAASEAMARHDSNSMKQYKSMIYSVGREYGIDPALIAAIISRESRAGTLLKNGWGDWSPSREAYNAFGLMQIDVNPKGGGHKPTGEWDSEEHLEHATGILVGFIKRIGEKFPNWSTEQKLKGGIAAYNMGDGNVHSYDNVDENTTGKDYSNDVVARAKWYRRNGFEC